MKEMVSGVTIECVKGNITAQKEIDVIVNAANAQLQSGGGVAGAIHRAAGPELAIESARLAPIKPGEAVITRAYKLPNKYVIHCLGPVYGVDEPAAVLLANCYRNSLKIAEHKNVTTVAFPAISTGAFGYPLEAAAEIAIKTVLEAVPGLRHIRRVRFVLYSKENFEVFGKILSLLIAEAKKM
ncbi:MAG: macro domain-containing protein [candidate division WOR-3 bacterium]|nr:MAG: macro domain-containing protein [candidate division WOR-3 bacterium]